MKNRESDNSALLLQGTISGLRQSRRSHDFVLTEVQHQQISVTAIAASLMGMSATGIGLIGMAGNSEEEADWIEFELDGKHMQGWLWMMPMNNGEAVEVVAEATGNNHYVVYAVKRDIDNLLAVYPHATAGRKAHYRRSVKVWIWCSLVLYFLLPLFLVMQRGFGALFDEKMHTALIIGFASFISVSAVIAFRVSRKLMGFVKIAEIIFKTFGWTDIENIDLRKTSRENRRDERVANFGNLYFRYK